MPEPRPPVVAIDGPAGAGKSTVARLLAQKLGLYLLDTGAMYRALAVKAAREGVSLEDETALAVLAASTDLSFGSANAVLLDGQDVSSEIRTPEASQGASRLSVHPRVRSILVARQRDMLKEGGCVLEGRDTTTVVAPDADLKVFLTASVEERARRRWLEERKAGQERSLQEVVVDVVGRDHRDYSRTESPLTLAEDAVIVESFGLEPTEIAERLAAMLFDRLGVVTRL